MVAGLQHDASIAKLKLLELERAVRCLSIWATVLDHFNQNEGLQNVVMHDVHQSFEI
jgi:hypothetical protein